MSDRIHQLKQRAEAARSKPPRYGADVNLQDFTGRSAHLTPLKALAHLPEQDKKQMQQVGIVPEEQQRAGTFIVANDSTLYARSQHEGLELLPTTQALKKYDWLTDYYWKAVEVDSDKFTAYAELQPFTGYFIRVTSGTKVRLPLQSCLYLLEENFLQNLHHLIIVEEDAELTILTGCTRAHQVNSGLHIGVTEIFLKPRARLFYTMIHTWGTETVVRPRTGIIIDQDATFVSNYISFRQLRDLQMYPQAYIQGKGGTAIFNSVVVAPQHARIDLGSSVIIDAPEGRGEIISRAISRGGHVIARGRVRGAASQAKGHIECRGLMLSEEGKIDAVPQLEAHASQVELSHEAAIGKIAEEEIFYLMARGLTQADATSLIVRGFLNIKMEGIPPALQQQIQRLLVATEKESL